VVEAETAETAERQGELNGCYCCLEMLARERLHEIRMRSCRQFQRRDCLKGKLDASLAMVATVESQSGVDK
jgi:hypothetical protein